MKFLSPVDVDGYISLITQNPGVTPTKYLIQDANGRIAFRTGQELKVDIGADYTSVLKHQVKASVAINKGQAVYAIPTQDGTNILVGLASNNSEATSSKTMGLLNATVSINGFADVITEGLLSGLDTSTATVGNSVWLGTNGNLIYGLAAKPYAPAHLVFIGIVTRVNANNGEIFVKVQNGFELDELHDVDLKTTTPINGHLLGFNGTLWVNKTIAGWLGYTPQDAATAITTSNIGSQSVNYANSAAVATNADYANAAGYAENAGTLDGYDSSYFAVASHTHIISPVVETLVPQNGISIQAGPGGGNGAYGWEYPYGTRLSAITGAGRSFEIMSTTYPGGELVMRTLGSGSVWDPWKKMLDTSNYSGYSNFSGAVYGTIYYDANNTSYYIDPASYSRLNQLSIGSVNTSYLLYNNGNSYFNGSVEIDDTLYVSSGYSVRAPIFYDSNNTGYYIDPASTSNLYGLTVNQTISGNITSANYLSILGGSGGNLNTMGYGRYYNYGSGSYWTNGPSGMSYGSVYNFGGSSESVLSLQLAADINHNSTSSTRTMWFRTGNNLGFQNDWKEILHTGNYSSFANPTIYKGVNAYTNFQSFVSTPGTIRFDQCNATGGFSNAPGGYTYGGVLSMRGDNFGYQLWGSHTGDFYFKTQWQDDQYSGWRAVLHSGNYVDYAWQRSGSWKPGSLSSSTRLVGTTSPDGGEFGLAYSAGQIHPYTDGFFYQNEGQYRVIDSNSISSQSVSYANNAGGANTATWADRLNTVYAGGQQLNPQTYFNNGIGLRVAMTAAAGVWSDTLWINGYSGGDVLQMCALHTKRDGTPRMYISAQASTATSYGTLYEILSNYGGTGTYGTTGDFRAPIFYDSNDTGYYCDPNSTSRLNIIRPNYIQNPYDISVDHQFGIFFNASVDTAYGIYREAGGWGYPYPDLRIAFHTGLKFGANANYNGMRFYTDYDMATQVMSINDGSAGLGGGNVYVYNSLQAGSSLRAPVYYDSNDTSYFFDGSSTGDSIRVAGDIVAYYSDERLKDRKGNIENALEKVLSLNGFYYEPNEKAQSLGYQKKLEVGVSAQEVEAILPEIIKDAPIGHGYKTLNYGKLTPLLIEAIKEQQTQIEELKQLVNQLINK